MWGEWWIIISASAENHPKKETLAYPGKAKPTAGRKQPPGLFVFK